MIVTKNEETPANNTAPTSLIFPKGLRLNNVLELLASNTKDGYYFILPSLSAALRLFIHWFPNVNWWTVYSIFVMFSGLLILNLLIVRAIKGFAGISVAVIFSSFMWINMLGIDIN